MRARRGTADPLSQIIDGSDRRLKPILASTNQSARAARNYAAVLSRCCRRSSFCCPKIAMICSFCSSSLGKMDAISLGGAPSGRLAIMRPMWLSIFLVIQSPIARLARVRDSVGIQRKTITPPTAAMPSAVNLVIQVIQTSQLGCTRLIVTAPWLAKASSRGDMRPARSI